MTVVAVTSSNQRNAVKCIQAVAGRVETRLVGPKDLSSPPDSLLEGMGGLLLTGGPDIDPPSCGDDPGREACLQTSNELDGMELALLRCALGLDMPVLGICRGMQLLNEAFGGGLLQDIPGHNIELKDGHWASAHHSIFLSPGSKLAAILGMGGFFRVNSLHHQGLREAQKAPRLLASAYCVEDGIIEGLESPDHRWVVGVQCHPERHDEVPKAFVNLFTAFVERAEAYGETA